MERQKIETQYKWTIDEMYPSESDLNKDIDKVKELIDKLASYKGKLANLIYMKHYILQKMRAEY